MRKVFFLVLLFWTNLALAQEVLVPFRVGDLFGLSDVKGNLKVKPAYDYIEPIGEGYYKYSNFTKVLDTINWVSGRVEIREKTKAVTGVLFGTKVIIQNSLSRHFTVVKNAMLIGSEESYISKNSNFYNLKGKKLLSENVEKFKFLANGKMNLENTPIIAVFAEHFDKSFSILLYDIKKQDFIKPLISNGQNVKLERKESSEEYIVLSYNDEKYNSYKVSIYFDDSKNTFVKVPYSNRENYSSRSEEMMRGYDVVVEDRTGEMRGEREPDAPPKYNSTTESKPVKPVVIPKKVYPFIKVNDSLFTYNGKEIRPSVGGKILFAERYNKSQMQPLIFTEGAKFGLIFSDSLRSQVLYDSLRYIKNQYSIFSSGYSMIYLVGKKTLENNNMVYGIIDEKGKEIIPITYDYLCPNLLEIYQLDTEIKKKPFAFRQPYNYSDDKNALLTLNREGLLTVGKNGKFGVVNLKNEVLLPIEYDNVWKNGFSFLKTFKVKEDFFVYKKGELYGAFKFESKGITNDTGLKFPMIPVYVYQNYMGIKGLNIYNLAVEGNLFFCLAADDGTVYYREAAKK